MRNIDKPSWKMKQKLFSELRAFMEVWRAKNLLDENKEEKYEEIHFNVDVKDVSDLVQRTIR